MEYSLFEKLCAEKGVKPYHVSQATGISTSSLTSWKKRNFQPKADKLKLLADYFEVPIEYLVTGEMPEKKSSSGKSYYFDDKAAEVAQIYFDDPNYRILFDAARGSSPENLQLAAEILQKMKRTNPDG